MMLIPSTILLIFFRINFTLNYKIYRLIFINKFDYLFDYLFENNFFSSCTIINIIALKEYYFFFYYRILLTQLPILLVKTGKKKQFIYKELALRVVCGGLLQFVAVWEFMGAAKGENVCASPSPEISKEVDPSHASETLRIVNAMGAATPIPANCNARGFYDAFLRSFIKVDHIQRGRISCTVVAKPPICVSLFHFFFYS